MRRRPSGIGAPSSTWATDPWPSPGAVAEDRPVPRGAGRYRDRRDRRSLKVLFHVKHEGELRSLAADVVSLGVDVTDEALGRLERFEELLRERAVPIGAVSRSDAGRIRERHILDCLRAVTAMEGSDRLAFDIGSGAGLPGIVVACARPGLHVRLVEPRRRRVAFLELAIERLELSNASVDHARIQDVEGEGELCLARAFAPVVDAWEAALPHLRPGGRLVYFAGSRAEAVPALEGASGVRMLDTPVLESSGPLIIMTR